MSRRAWLVAGALATAGGLLGRASWGMALALGGSAWASGTSGNLLRTYGPRPKRPAQRVFAAGPPAAALVAVLAPEALLGWPMVVPDAARRWLPEPTRELPVTGRLAGRGSTVGPEAVLALKPDWVVDVGTVDATYLSAAQRIAAQTGLPYALLDGRLADTPQQLRELGELLGVSARAQTLAEQADRILERARASAAAARHAPSVYLARGADGLETAGAGSINAEWLDLLGGRNAAQPGPSGVGRVSMEHVLGWDPDWIVTQEAAFCQRVRSDALWRSLRAVRAGRVLCLPALPLGWVDGPPGVNRLLGLAWLQGVLQRGEAPHAASPHVRQRLEELSQLFALLYGTSPSPAQLQSWLLEAA